MSEIVVCNIGDLKSIRCNDCGKRITFGAKYCMGCYHKRRKQKLNQNKK